MICINDDYEFWFEINVHMKLKPIYSAQTNYLILNDSGNKIVLKDISINDLEISLDISKFINNEYDKKMKSNNSIRNYKIRQINKNSKYFGYKYPCNSIECNYDLDNSIISLLLIGVDKLTDDKMSFLPKHFYCTKYASVGSYIVNSIHVIKYLNLYVKRRILAKIRAIGKFIILYNKHKIFSCMESLD